jgi:hypothetical protein
MERLIYVAGAVGVAGALYAVLGGAPGAGATVITGVSVAAALVAAPLAFRAPAAARLAAAARITGRLSFYVLALLLSFSVVAARLRFVDGFPPQLVPALVPFLAAAAFLLAGLRDPGVDSLARGEAMLVAATALAFLLGLSLETGRGAALVASLAIAFLALGRIVRGVSWRARASLAEGLVLGALLGAARLVELLGPAALRP